MDVKRGEIYFADLGEQGVGSEQNGFRPVLIVQNNTGNKFSPTVIVACITSKTEKTKVPTHVAWNDNIILCEQIKTIDKTRLRNFVAKLSVQETERVNHAIRVSVGIPNF